MLFALVAAIKNPAVQLDRTDLVEEARRGNQAAMQELYELYSKAMLNTSYRILNRREDAEDAIQEAFVKAFSKLDQYTAEATFGAWLRRIVVNQSINLLKRRDRLDLEGGGQIPDEVAEPTFPERYEEREKLEVIHKAIHLLPDGYRTVFSLYLIEGYDHQEISEILGIGVSSSISQLSRAKNKLKRIINEMGNDD